MTRRGLVLGVVALLAVAGVQAGAPAPASAQGQSPPGGWMVDNGTQANADDRGRRQLSFAWQLHETDTPRLAARNRAKATTSCDGCRAVAVSVEIVIASHVRQPVEALNLARSITDCSHCASTAIAFQFVVASPDRLVLRPAARVRIEQLRRALRRAALAGGSDVVVRRRAERLAAQLAEVLRTGVVGTSSSAPRPAVTRP